MATFERLRNQTDFVQLDVRKCKACWKCLDKCPDVITKVSFLWHKHVVIGRADECIGCLKCVKVCPEGAFMCISTNNK